LTVTLGLQPFDLTVTLPSDGDFVCTLIAENGWPVDTRIELRFLAAGVDPIVWPATIDGTDARWSVRSTVVKAAIAAKPTAARLHYIDSAGEDLLWGRGRVLIA